MNIVNTWIDIVRNEKGETLTDGIKKLNRITGLRVTQSQIYKWRNRVNVPNSKAINYMIQYVFKYVLDDAGIDTRKITLEQYESIFNQLLIPIKM